MQRSNSPVVNLVLIQVLSFEDIDNVEKRNRAVQKESMDDE